MATIVIKDLTESVDLDRQAMLAITGGARIRGRRPPYAAPSPLRGSRIIDYPGTPSLGGRHPATEIPGTAGRE